MSEKITNLKTDIDNHNEIDGHNEIENNNADRTIGQFFSKYKLQIFGLAILIAAIIAFIVWGSIEYSAYNRCRNNESFYWPRIGCNDLPDGSSGTKCYNSNTQTGDRVAWRDLPDGSFECQGITINKNIVTNYDYANYSR